MIQSISVIQPFTGKLFYIGGSYNESIIYQINKLSFLPEYKRNVELKVYSERSENSLIPPSIFIHLKEDCDFIDKIINREEIEVSMAYELFPTISRVETIIEELKQNPGKHHSFHSGERCKIFSTIELRFVVYQESEPVLPSLSMYTINSYQYLVVVRIGELEAVVNLRWGRFIYLYLTNCTVGIFHFDVSKNILAVPASLLLPPEVERIFYLSTGRLPMLIRMLKTNSKLHKDTKGKKLFIVSRNFKKRLLKIYTSCLGQKPSMISMNLLKYNLCLIH